MSSLLAAFGATLLLGALQENKPEFKWDLKPDYVFDLKWTFQETSDQKRPTGQGNSSGSSRLLFVDRRAIEATVTVLEKPGVSGPLKIELKKVSWLFDQPEYTVQLAYSATKKKNPLGTKVRVKAKPGSPEASRAYSIANSQADRMKMLVESAYTIQTDGRQGLPQILRNNSPQKNSLFEKIYLYSRLPKGSVNRGQKWRGELTGLTLPTGLVQLKTIDYKVTTVTAKAITVKAAFTIPIVKPPTVTDQNTTGSFKYSREYSFSPDGFLTGSKETSAFTKKVTSGQRFFKEDVKVNMEQKLTITKRKPPREKKTR